MNSDPFADKLSVTKDDKSWDAENSEALCNIGILVNIDLADLDLALELLIELV